MTGPVIVALVSILGLLAVAALMVVLAVRTLRRNEDDGWPVLLLLFTIVPLIGVIAIAAQLLEGAS